MATVSPMDIDFNQSSETFCLVWLDSNLSEGRNTEQKLRSIINQLKKFQDLDQCQDFIHKTSSKDRLIFITSGKLGREILPVIHHLRQMISIYIYCMDKQENELWSSKYSKVKSVVTSLEELVSIITEDHQIEKKTEEPLAINIFSVGGNSTSGLNGKFVFSQVLIDCLLRLKSTDEDKNELIQLLKQQFNDNRFELEHINDFEVKYRSNEALQWYTKECFFYKTLNSILRTENIHWMFLYRSFTFDLQEQLKKYQLNEIIEVYRAQIISKEELENLKKSIDQFISINSFFSTTSSYSKALSFFNQSKPTEQTEKILFQIEADPDIVKTKSFAMISRFSAYPDEEEVLFMIGSIFRLRKIFFDNKHEFWIIEMTLSSDDDNQLEKVLTHMKQQIGEGPTNLRILANILWEMGKLDLARKYFEQFLEQIPINDPIRRELYENLAKIASQSNDFDKSMEWRQKCIEFKEKNSIASSSCSTSGPKELKWEVDGQTIAGGNGKGDKLNQLSGTEGIHIDHEEQCVYIVDRGNHRILKWKLGENNGQTVAGGNDQLNSPTDVIFDQKNKSLIICDQGNSRVVRWSLENPNDDKQILIENIECYGLMMNENGDLFVSDRRNHAVKRWRKSEIENGEEGTIVAGGNGKGNKLNQLNDPSYIFIDREERVYVSDWRNHRVMKWLKGANTGIAVAGGQDEGDSLKQLSYPEGLVVNEVGDIYVADSWNHRIMCWPLGSQEGRVIVGGNSYGQKSNQLYFPTSLTFDVENNLYVVDQSNDRIQRFCVDSNSTEQSCSLQ